MDYKFEVEVDTRPQVIIDETQWTKKDIQDFNDTFYDVSTIEDIAKCALKSVLNLGKSSFIEGFGYIKVNGSFPIGSKESQQCTSVEINNLYFNWELC